jgi:hypothetical protein
MLDPNKLYAKLIEAGEAWTESDYEATMLEETRKSLLAQLSLKHVGKSRAEAEQMALATEEYRAHVDGMVKARSLANKARVKYDSVRVYCELIRSAEATRRTEATLT